MQIGAVSLRPYIYNTNAVSAKSMNKISAIGDDALASKTDISALTSEDAKKAETTNPLKRGESLDFAGILSMQMQMSRLNESRILKPAEETVEADATQKITSVTQGVANMYQNSQNMASMMGFEAAI